MNAMVLRPALRDAGAILRACSSPAKGALLALALLAAGPATAIAAEARPPQVPELDQLVDVGGHRLYLRCTGHGNPTVVMDAALGTDSGTWHAVEPMLSRFTRVCVYDRAGTGHSDPAEGCAPARRWSTSCAPCSPTPASAAPSSSSAIPSEGSTCSSSPDKTVANAS